MKSVLEEAKQQGKSTGLVATSEINHATPAAYGAHNESRKNMDQIANSYMALLYVLTPVANAVPAAAESVIL